MALDRVWWEMGYENDDDDDDAKSRYFVHCTSIHTRILTDLEKAFKTDLKKKKTWTECLVVLYDMCVWIN